MEPLDFAQWVVVRHHRSQILPALRRNLRRCPAHILPFRTAPSGNNNITGRVVGNTSTPGGGKGFIYIGDYVHIFTVRFLCEIGLVVGYLWLPGLLQSDSLAAELSSSSLLVLLLLCIDRGLCSGVMASSELMPSSGPDEPPWQVPGGGSIWKKKPLC